MTNCYTISEIGPARNDDEFSRYDKDTQEDSLIVDLDKKIFIIADGLSSVNKKRGKGKLASESAVNTAYDFLARMDPNKRINFKTVRRAFNETNNAIINRTEGFGGTTLDIVIVGCDHAIFGHAGDARIYHATTTKARSKERIVKQLTKDHGDFTGQDNFMGIPNYNVDTGIVHLKDNDLLALCTDGVHKFVNRDKFQKMLASMYTPEFIGQQLAKSIQEEMTAWERETDNFSLIVYRHTTPTKTHEQAPVYNNTPR